MEEHSVGSKHMRESAEVNALDEFNLGIRNQVPKLIVERMSENDGLVGLTGWRGALGLLVAAGSRLRTPG